MSKFRPISLCNVIYKLAEKVLANRLKCILDDIIYVNQGTFVPGRLITDNVIASFKLNQFLRRKTRGSKGHFALKLDMKKAYDRVEWSFIDRMRKKWDLEGSGLILFYNAFLLFLIR